MIQTILGFLVFAIHECDAVTVHQPSPTIAPLERRLNTNAPIGSWLDARNNAWRTLFCGDNITPRTTGTKYWACGQSDYLMPTTCARISGIDTVFWSWSARTGSYSCGIACVTVTWYEYLDDKAPLTGYDCVRNVGLYDAAITDVTVYAHATSASSAEATTESPGSTMQAFNSSPGSSIVPDSSALQSRGPTSTGVSTNIVESTNFSNPANNEASNNRPSAGMSPGTKAAAALGAILGVLSIVGIIIFYLKRRKKPREPNADGAQDSEQGGDGLEVVHTAEKNGVRVNVNTPNELATDYAFAGQDRVGELGGAALGASELPTRASGLTRVELHTPGYNARYSELSAQNCMGELGGAPWGAFELPGVAPAEMDTLGPDATNS